MSASSTLPSFDPSAPATGDGIFGLPHTPEQATVVLVPVPWEPTTSYGKGTAKGPAAILEASRQVDLFDLQTGRPYQAGIAMLEPDPDVARWNAAACVAAEPIIAAGGEIGGSPELAGRLARVNELSARLNERLAATTRRWIDAGKIVGVVGGDHASPFGSIAAHADRYPGLGVLHFDAHADLREAYEGFTDSHASILFNVARRLPRVSRIVQVGLRDLCEDEYLAIQRSEGRITAHFDPEIQRRLFEGEPFVRVVDEMLAPLPRDVYVTFDVDALDPALCPHTGTPVPGGLSFQQATFVLARLVASGRQIVGFDLNEVAPGPDGDAWDGNVGARLLYKLIGFALLSRKAAAPAGRRRATSKRA
ncbi:MAG TPA: agmatinase family protein [Minicystis sp.]|nr:agmatinase family protein [Minicystis sp.]